MPTPKVKSPRRSEAEAPADARARPPPGMTLVQVQDRRPVPAGLHVRPLPSCNGPGVVGGCPKGGCNQRREMLGRAHTQWMAGNSMEQKQGGAKAAGGRGGAGQVAPRHRGGVLATFGTGGAGAEIGVFKAQFSRAILAAAKPRKLYLIDPWQNMSDPSLKSAWYAEGSPNDMEAIYRQVQSDLRAEIESGQVELLRATSVDGMAQIADGTLDFVYIDGDHRYEAVCRDLALAMQKVRPGGIIALDDYFLGGWWGDGVVRATNEFIGAHPSRLRIERAGNGQVVLRHVGDAN